MWESGERIGGNSGIVYFLRLLEGPELASFVYPPCEQPDL